MHTISGRGLASAHLHTGVELGGIGAELAAIDACPDGHGRERAWYPERGSDGLRWEHLLPGGRRTSHFMRDEMVRNRYVRRRPDLRADDTGAGECHLRPAGRRRDAALRAAPHRRSGRAPSGSSAPSLRGGCRRQRAAAADSRIGRRLPPSRRRDRDDRHIRCESPTVRRVPSLPHSLGTTPAGDERTRGADALRSRDPASDRPAARRASTPCSSEFQDARWFAAGPAIELPADRFTRVGSIAGSAVYAENGHARDDLPVAA